MRTSDAGFSCACLPAAPSRSITTQITVLVYSSHTRITDTLGCITVLVYCNKSVGLQYSVLITCPFWTLLYLLVPYQHNIDIYGYLLRCIEAAFSFSLQPEALGSP